MLPTFAVIGAMKSGTTALARLLDQHPEVSIAPEKEVRFFSHDENWERGVEWYQRQFAGSENARAVGDASPAYAFHPVFPHAAERMAAVVPGIALVYIVRDPIDRIRSQYLHDTRAGRVIDEEIDDAVRRHERYIACSRYATQIGRYLAHFDPSQLLVVTSEGLRDDPVATLRRVHTHLGVDPGFVPDDPTERHNEASAVSRRTRPGLRRVRRLPIVKRAVGHLPASTRDRVAGFTSSTRDAGEATIGGETRHWLVDQLADEVAGIRPYLPDDFDGWGLDVA